MNWVAAACIATLASALSAGFARAECPKPDGVRIDVDIAAGPVETLFDSSLKELERLARAAGRDAHLPLRAVYISNVLFGANIKVEGGAQPPCAVARSIDVRIVISHRTIRVARELKDKACLLAAATTHAAGHARHEEETLLAARDEIASNLREQLRQVTTAETEMEAEQRLARTVSAQINADLARLDADGSAAAKTIDSIDALARLKTACPDEQADLVNERT